MQQNHPMKMSWHFGKTRKQTNLESIFLILFNCFRNQKTCVSPKCRAYFQNQLRFCGRGVRSGGLFINAKRVHNIISYIISIKNYMGCLKPFSVDHPPAGTLFPALPLVRHQGTSQVEVSKC
jgi:hypothetical protein